MLLKKKSISTSMTIGLVTTVILIVATLLVVQYVTQRYARRAEMERKADEYAVGLTTILAIPLWTLDIANTEHIGEVYRQNELFASLNIMDNRGNSIFSFGMLPPPSQGIIRTQNIAFEGETIGYLEFSLSLEPYNKGLNGLVQAALLTLAVATLVILLATGALLRVFMRKPLAALVRGMDSVSRGDFSSHPIEAGFSELENIVSTFRDMAGTIQARESALLQVNQVLSKEVAERKIAEEARAKSESTLTAIFNAAPIGIGQVHNRIISWPNEGLMNMTGYTSAELNDRPSEFLYASNEEFKRVGNIIYKSIATKETASIESRWITKQGETIDVIITLSHIVPGDPDAGLVFTALDITARKRAEAALRESEQRLHLALTGSNDGLWDWGITTDKLYYSPRFADILGYGEDELPCDISACYKLITHPDDYDRVWQFTQDYLTHGHGEFAQEFRGITKNGATRWIMMRGMIAERSMEGEPTRMVGTHKDISERKAAEKMREELIGELEDKNAELERFTYTVSHDLKSPIITIKGFLGMLERDMDAHDQERIKSDINRIHQAADKMQLLLDELLELSRVGRLVNQPEDIDLKQLTLDVVELVSGRLEKKNIAVNIQDDLPVIRGDRPRIQEVFLNIVDNAAKFIGDQDNPTITIGVRQEGDDQVFFVSDNGIGIKKEHFGKVFSLFDQLDPKKEGTGIGLALVQRIVEVHGGTIWVESDGPGTGTTFCFTLPGMPQPAAPA
ncbi:MAG: PAS domain S-box protein [Proteobacteria bacterium]|nr:PAS domain S-box protein [Pseudomonadota bacterium]